MLTRKGRARVFESESDAADAILAGGIVAGDVVVIRYEGPKGAPGMPEMLSPTATIAGIGMDKEEITVTVKLGRGTAAQEVLTCDLSYDYVKINAEYRT